MQSMKNDGKGRGSQGIHATPLLHAASISQSLAYEIRSTACQGSAVGSETARVAARPPSRGGRGEERRARENSNGPISGTHKCAGPNLNVLEICAIMRILLSA